MESKLQVTPEPKQWVQVEVRKQRVLTTRAPSFVEPADTHVTAAQPVVRADTYVKASEPASQRNASATASDTLASDALLQPTKHTTDQPNKKADAASYQKALEVLKNELAAGVDPMVDTAFVQCYWKASRAKVTRCIADGRLPQPSKSGSKNVWKYSALSQARDAMLSRQNPSNRKKKQLAEPVDSAPTNEE